jgi:hypothetical protein
VLVNEQVTLPRPRRHLKLSFQTMKTNQAQKHKMCSTTLLAWKILQLIIRILGGEERHLSTTKVIFQLMMFLLIQLLKIYLHFTL